MKRRSTKPQPTGGQVPVPPKPGKTLPPRKPPGRDSAEAADIKTIHDHVKVNDEDSMRALQDHLHQREIETGSKGNDPASLSLSGSSSNSRSNGHTGSGSSSGENARVTQTEKQTVSVTVKKNASESNEGSGSRSTKTNTATNSKELGSGSTGSKSGSGTGGRPSIIPPRKSGIQTAKNKSKKKGKHSSTSSSDDDSETDSEDSDDEVSKKRQKMMKRMRMMGAFGMQMRQQQAAYYNYCCQQQAYRTISPEQFKMTPIRSAAFVPQNVDLLENGGRPPPPPCGSGDEDDELEDGVAFSYKPRPTGRTEMTVTVEPKKQPWLTMMRFGFRPVVNCTAPPCYLSPNNCPGLQFQPGGHSSYVNHAHGSQSHPHSHLPTLEDIRRSTNPQEQGSSSSSSVEYSDESEIEVQTRRKKRQTPKKQIGPSNKPSAKMNNKQQPQLERNSDVTNIDEDEVDQKERETGARASVIKFVSDKERNHSRHSLPSLSSGSSGSKKSKSLE